MVGPVWGIARLERAPAGNTVAIVHDGGEGSTLAGGKSEGCHSFVGLGSWLNPAPNRPALSSGQLRSRNGAIVYLVAVGFQISLPRHIPSELRILMRRQLPRLAFRRHASTFDAPNLAPFRVFDRNAKQLQKDRAAMTDGGERSRTVDYVRNEVADRMFERFSVNTPISLDPSG